MKKVLALVIVVIASLMISVSAFAAKPTKAMVFTISNSNYQIENGYKLYNLEVLRAFLKPVSVRRIRINLVVLGQKDVGKLVKIAKEYNCKLERQEKLSKKMEANAKELGIAKPVAFFTYSLKKPKSLVFTDPKPANPAKPLPLANGKFKK